MQLSQGNYSNCCRSLKYLLFIFLFSTLSLSFSVNAVQPKQLQKVGDGIMSWMFIDIYYAKFATKSGDYKPEVYPQSLTITYLKNITKKRLIKATKEQWRLQGFDNNKIKRWLQAIEKIWPDIKSGESLTFYVDENKKGTFYHNQTLLGEINSNSFSPAFLAIWLSDKTSQPKLRQQLLGL